MCSTRGIKIVRHSDFLSLTKSMLVKVLLLTALSLALNRHRPDRIEDDLMQKVPWSWDPLFVLKQMPAGTADEKPKKIKEISEILSNEILRYSEEMLRKDMEDDLAREVVVQTRNGRNKWNRIQKRAEKMGWKDQDLSIINY